MRLGFGVYSMLYVYRVLCPKQLNENESRNIIMYPCTPCVMYKISIERRMRRLLFTQCMVDVNSHNNRYPRERILSQQPMEKTTRPVRISRWRIARGRCTYGLWGYSRTVLLGTLADYYLACTKWLPRHMTHIEILCKHISRSSFDWYQQLSSVNIITLDHCFDCYALCVDHFQLILS